MGQTAQADQNPAHSKASDGQRGRAGGAAPGSPSLSPLEHGGRLTSPPLPAPLTSLCVRDTPVSPQVDMAGATTSLTQLHLLPSGAELHPTVPEHGGRVDNAHNEPQVCSSSQVRG